MISETVRWLVTFSIILIKIREPVRLGVVVETPLDLLHRGASHRTGRDRLSGLKRRPGGFDAVHRAAAQQLAAKKQLGDREDVRRMVG